MAGMRFVKIVLSLGIIGLMLAQSVHAQEQERTLVERLLEPDREMSNTSFDKNFYGGSKFQHRNGAAAVRDFHFVNKVAAKGFLTRDFGGSRNHWMGDFQFDTREAHTGRRSVVKNAEEEYQTRDFGVRALHDGGKTAETKAVHDANREFRGREADRMTRVIDPDGKLPGWQGTLAPMTVDDVRELLNKNE